MTKIKIKIHNSSWNVILKSLQDVDGEPAGITFRDIKTILINSDFTIELRNTIIHELVHAFVYEYGFSQVDMTSENHAEFIAAYLDDIYLLTNKIEKKFMSQLTIRWL